MKNTKLLLLAYAAAHCTHLNTSYIQNMELEMQRAQRDIAPYQVIDISKAQAAIPLAIPTEYKILVDNCVQLGIKKTLDPALLQAILKYAKFVQKNSPHPNFEYLIVVTEQALGKIAKVSKNIKHAKELKKKHLIKRVIVAATQAAITIAQEVDIAIHGKEQFKDMRGHYNRTTHYAYLIDKDGKKINFTNIHEYNKTVTPYQKPLVQFATLPTPGYSEYEDQKAAGGLLATTTLYGKKSIITGPLKKRDSLKKDAETLYDTIKQDL